MNTFLILDAARCGSESIEEATSLCSQKPGVVFPLTNNELYLEMVAPHLFHAEYIVKKWFAEHGWGDSWGLIFESGASFENCLSHFQRIVIRNGGTGSRYFRFYDPRVLKIFLPTCDEKQTLEFFGPVEAFIVEGERKDTAIVYQQRQGILQTTETTFDTVFGPVEKIGNAL